MRRAAAAVTTIEVTTAGASRRADGIYVREGEAIALLNGTLVASAVTAADALAACLRKATIEAGSLITLYKGDGVDPAEAEVVANSIRSQHPGVEIEVVDGGQPLYPYIASVE
jgi:dihydroxyacetone kinase-like predicted kinase